MNNAVTRACAWISVALSTYAPLCAAQTMQVVTGGARFVDVPGTTIPIQPETIAVGPDGLFYITDLSSRLVRFDPTLGTVSALPVNAANTNLDLGYVTAMAFDPAGVMHVISDGQLKRVDYADGTLTTLATMPQVTQMVFAPNGTLYFVSPDENRVRARLTDGTIIDIAGREINGFGGDGGPATSAYLNWPQSVIIGPDGNLYIADRGNNRIRKVDRSTGIITTVAGTGNWSYNGDGLPALQTDLPSPDAIAFDAAGNLYVGGYGDFRLRRIDAVTGLVSSPAGTGVSGYSGDGGPATTAQVYQPRTLAFDAGGNLYFSDSTITGSVVRRIANGTRTITRVIGNDTYYFCGNNVPARFACFGQAYGIDAAANGDLVVSDLNNRRVRRISGPTGKIATIGDWPALSPLGVEHDAAGNIFVATYGGYQVQRIDAVTGLTSVVAGRGGYGLSGDGGPATAATLASPTDVALDSSGNLYIADQGNNRVRKVNPSGIISTYASFTAPATVEVDPAGNLIVAGQDCRLRRVDAATQAVITLAGTGLCAGLNPPGGTQATATNIGTYPAFALDPAGNIFFGWSNVLYRIDATNGLMTRVPASGALLTTPEGIGFSHPSKLEFDAQGNLYLTDQYKPFVFRISGLLDSTPPAIQPVISGLAGPGGWYRSDVHVSWVVSDGESAVSSSTGCSNSSVTTDTSGVAFTCTATSIGGTATQTVTIKRDTAPPTLSFGAISPAPDASGWNSGDVSIPFATSDTLSGVYSTSSASPVAIAGDGAGLNAQVVVTDLAGNSATFTTPTVNIDRSAPQIESAISGTPGNADWYTSDVQVTWTVTENGSPAVVNGCNTVTVSADTAGTTFTCTATSAGGTTSKSVTIKRDATPPTLVWSDPSPAPNAAGWFTSNVEFTYTTGDATSGVSGTSQPVPGPVVVTEDGPGQTNQITVWDNAGNQAIFFTPPVNIDHVPPQVQPFVNGVMGPAVWHKDDVQLHWNVVENNILSSSGCQDRLINTDTAGTAFTCSVTSGAGTTTESVIIKRDATAPTLSWGSFSPAPNTGGWNKTNVTVPFTGADATSGVATTSATSPLTISAEGPGVTGQVTVTDNAGNSKVFTTAPRNIDKTAPVVALTVPANGVTYGFYQDVVADFACTDVSLVSCTGTNADGELLNTKTAGARTFKVTAKDAVAFTTTITNSFDVASAFNFEGFLPNLQPYPTNNLVAKGSLVPIRWRLPDGNGGYVSNTASFTSVAVTTTACSGAAPPLNDPASGPAGISFDPATNAFTYNWQTSTSWTGCRTLTVKFKDGAQRQLVFKLQ